MNAVKLMNEIIHCYKLYIKHTIIVDKHIKKVNKCSNIAIGYRLAAHDDKISKKNI